jgi:hypothetical protein
MRDADSPLSSPASLGHLADDLGRVVRDTTNKDRKPRPTDVHAAERAVERARAVIVEIQERQAAYEHHDLSRISRLMKKRRLEAEARLAQAVAWVEELRKT